MSNTEIGKALEGIDSSKRATLDKLVKGAAFATPVVASFAMDALVVSRAQAQVANGSGVTPD
ncbi:hypothetical protein E8L99_19585 [Phreatobacter aquaticus]|uniref:Uncharacterized protein n=1 Tax=Phreatobacter aquaticus TaxID=2570229 RepID=A0A4D7QJN6_9HYPH|nr:hypothetical protein [Phreatobacter aquaticus]QCK87798.1 hypothetical protein E8L99_19585 [Phreatobacter aquaticus]